MYLPDLSCFTHLLRNAEHASAIASRKKGQKLLTRPSRLELAETLLKLQLGENKPKVMASNLDIKYITHKFPPSVAPISTLAKTYIDELLLETNHRGSYLLLRTVGCPVKKTAIISVVEDEKGVCGLIHLYNIDKSRDWAKFLSAGQVIIAKEPFYKSDVSGETGTGIFVDHISDVLFLGPGDDRIPEAWQSHDHVVDKTAVDWKKEGYALFQNSEFHEAIECCTRGLKIGSDDIAVIKTLRLNRSQAFLSLGFHENALEDSEYVLNTLDTTDKKALLLAGKALYLARRFGDSKTYLQTLTRNNPKNKEAKAELLRVYRRQQEEQTGKYDFHEMKRLNSSTGGGLVELDYADFVGPVHLQTTTETGRGLYATRDIKFGELLLCSKAFQVCYPQIHAATLVVNVMENRLEMSSCSQLVTEIIRKAYNNPSTSKELVGLYSGTYERVNEEYIDGRPVVDTFLIDEIQKNNNFHCDQPPKNTLGRADTDGEDSREPQGVGVWVMPSYINHACWGPGLANRNFIGDMMIVRATVNIKKGEQITFAYTGDEGDVASRQELFMRLWGFTCHCRLCTAESQETIAIRNNRKARLDEILKLELLVDRQPTVNDLNNFLPRIVRSISSLEATYKNPPIEQPRYALMQGLEVLIKIYVRLGRCNEVIKTAECILEALGYKIEKYPSQGKIVFKQYGHMTEHKNLVNAFVRSTSAYMVLGNVRMAKACQKFAVDIYEVETGERASFSEQYEEIFKAIGLPMIK